MTINFNNNKPIYLQISEQLEDDIFLGYIKEETQIPSTTEISIDLKINPATVLKGINILVEQNIVYKKRGLGMFVCQGAVNIIKQKRQDNFFEDYFKKMVEEAKKLNLTKKEILEMIERGF